MTLNVLEYLEGAAHSAPERVAMDSPAGCLTWREMNEKARAVGSAIASLVPQQSPVLILMEKTPECVCAMMGTVYAGCFYTPLDSGMPLKRMKLIAGVLRPALILTQRSLKERAQELLAGMNPETDPSPEQEKETDTESHGENKEQRPFVMLFEETGSAADQTLLRQRRENHIDLDLLYVLFTSGSTGIPKGVSICHRSVIDFIEWAVCALALPDGVRFASQAPFYFDNSVLDLYCAMRMKGSVYLTPREDFTFPKKLAQALREQHIDTIFWVPSALTSLASSGLLVPGAFPELKRVFFCGEVMPVRTLNAWKEAVPQADYVNMYGPTEITDVCAWYRVDRTFDPEEALPIGRPCANTRIYLLDGELCVAGTCLSRGYYGDPGRTGEAFVQNPLRPQIQERIYRTGDLARYNDRGELMFLGRKDSQIKRNGFRIELGEIESVLGAMDGVELACCWYESETERIRAVFTGTAQEKAVRKSLKAALPRYMIPDHVLHLEEMPRTGSGKIDRQTLRKEYGS